MRNELSGEERERAEKYFLSTTERHAKLEFAAELLRRAESERGRQVAVKDVRPGFFEQIAAFWRPQSFARVALLAVVLLVGGFAVYQMWPARTATYLALNIAISDADRADGIKPDRVKLQPNTGLKITLTIPEGARDAKSYVARLAGGNDLQIEPPTENTVTVVIPAGKLTPNTYAIQLFKVKADNSQERIPGSYYFAIE